jgi:hypothetical protein
MDSTYEAKLKFVPDREAIWHVPSLVLGDAAGNRTNLSKTELEELGFEPKLVIKDRLPPELVQCPGGRPPFNFAPTFIDVTASPETVTVTMCVTDFASGFVPTAVSFEDESGGFLVGAVPSLIPGSALEYAAALEFRSDLPPGLWRVAEPLILKDFAGNTATLTRSDLARLTPPPPPALEVVAGDIDVSPVVLDFGALGVGLWVNQVVTITNLGGADLGVTRIELDPSSDADFSIGAAPDLGPPVGPDQSIDVELLFKPAAQGVASAILRITSDDPDQALVEVVLDGTGVTHSPPNVLGPILDFFEESVGSGELTGGGPGPLAQRRLMGLWSTLEAAGDSLGAGRIDRACNQLLEALLRTQDAFPTPRFVAAGPAALDLAARIEEAWTRLGCNVQCGDVDQSGTLGPEDVSRVRDYLLRVAPEPPFDLARCSVWGQPRACDVRDVARIQRAAANLSVPLESVCQTAATGP